MRGVFDLISLACCVLISVQDFKSREISVFPLIILFLNLGISALLQYPWTDIAVSTGINLLFIIVNLLIVMIYFSVRHKRPVHIIDQHIGLGDVLFFIAVSAAFGVPDFLLYFLLSLLTAIFSAAFIRSSGEAGGKHIPLAGIMAAVFVFFLIFKYSFHTDIFHSGFLLRWMNPV